MTSSILIHPDELTQAWVDRAASHRIDIIGIHPRGGKEAPTSLAELLDLCGTEQFRSLVDKAYDRGMRVEYEFHAAGYLVPRELFDTHPEYFRMNEEGERVADSNFCISNKEAMAMAVERARDTARRLYRSTDRYYFWMDDSRNKACHCPQCRHMTTADQQMLFCEHILAGLRQDNPNATLAYLAYFDTMRLPTMPCNKDGLFLEYAPIEKSKTDADPVFVAEEIRMAKELCAYFGTENARVLEYWLDNSLFSKWKKPPQAFAFTSESIAAMQKDIADYRAMGFNEMATFACFLGPDYEELHGEPDIKPFGDCFV